MSHSDKSILVTGATGRQGGAVIRNLSRQNWKVKALSRTPDSIAAQKLISDGISVSKGDMADTSSLAKAMDGCHGVFSIQNYFEYGGDKEVLYGKNMVDAAKTSDIPHFIYSSVMGAENNSSVPHFKTKF
jgi:uncharacterized protein YbjT (DUF2867 family)